MGMDFHTWIEAMATSSGIGIRPPHNSGGDGGGGGDGGKPEWPNRIIEINSWIKRNIIRIARPMVQAMVEEAQGTRPIIDVRPNFDHTIHVAYRWVYNQFDNQAAIAKVKATTERVLYQSSLQEVFQHNVDLNFELSHGLLDHIYSKVQLHLNRLLHPTGELYGMVSDFLIDAHQHQEYLELAQQLAIQVRKLMPPETTLVPIDQWNFRYNTTTHGGWIFSVERNFKANK